MKSTNSSVSATDLATAQAEIWVLKKAIYENRVSIENLENLVKTIIEKQNVMLTEMYRLKRINVELREECRMQRDYHTMERNAMVRELHDVKTLLCNRSKLLVSFFCISTLITSFLKYIHNSINRKKPFKRIPS